MMTIACLVAAAFAGALAMTPFPVSARADMKGPFEGYHHVYVPKPGDKSTSSRNQIDRGTMEPFEQVWLDPERMRKFLNKHM